MGRERDSEREKECMCERVSMVGCQKLARGLQSILSTILLYIDIRSSNKLIISICANLELRITPSYHVSSIKICL